METLLVHAALLAYAIAAAAFLAWLVRPVPGRAIVGRALLSIGVFLHAVAVALGAGLATLGLGAPAWRGGQVFSVLGLLTAAGYLLLDRKGAYTLTGAFVAPLAVILMVPAHVVASTDRAVAPELVRSVGLFAHVVASALGSAALVLALGLGFLFLAGERQAKTKRPGRLFAQLSSLDDIDRAGYRVSVWGFVFLSIANGTGAWVSSAATGTVFPLASKEILAVLAWVLLAATIQARHVSGWRGKRSAVLVLAGSALLAGTWVALLSERVAPTFAAAAGVLP